jgi:hypothetical protein
MRHAQVPHFRMPHGATGDAEQSTLEDEAMGAMSGVPGLERVRAFVARGGEVLLEPRIPIFDGDDDVAGHDAQGLGLGARFDLDDLQSGSGHARALQFGDVDRRHYCRHQLGVLGCVECGGRIGQGCRRGPDEGLGVIRIGQHRCG